MEGIETKKKTLDALIFMNTCIRNMRLYPSTSSRIISAVERLHLALLDVLKNNESLTFEKSEKSVLFCGEPLDESDGEKWQVTAFAKILLDFDINNIAFGKDLEKGELTVLLEALSKKPEDIKSKGGLQKILQQKNIANILLNKEKEAVQGKAAIKKEHQLLSPDNITDDKIIQFFMRPQSETEGDSRTIREITKNTDYLLQIFRTCLFELMGQKEPVAADQTLESICGMISLMDKVSGSLENNERDKISQEVGRAIVSLGGDILRQIKEKDMAHLFGGSLVKHFTQEAPVKKDDAKEKTVDSPHKVQATPKVAEEEKSDEQNQISQLKKKLRTLPQDDHEPFLDEPLMLALPKLFEQLDVQKEHQAMALILSRLIGNLFSKNADVRLQASNALADIIDSFSRERQARLLESLSASLIEWIKLEPLTTLAYKKICNTLKNLIEDFIQEGRFAEAMPVLDIFSNISAGSLEKNDKAHEISLNIIRALASDENLRILFRAFNANNPDRQVEAGSVLVRLGDAAMNRVLDILRDKANSDERVRIIKLFIGVGNRAIPAIRERLKKTAPWYYLRNMAYILGHIGNESSAGALQPLLLHENKRLRLEALKSIYKTGGEERGPLLLSVLPQADDHFKLNIIEALGNAKCAEAVPEFLNMLEKRKSATQELRAELEEKICTALGSIGSGEALSALTKISKANSFLRFRRYDKKVKAAAGVAVVSIRKKQEEAKKEAAAKAANNIDTSK